MNLDELSWLKMNSSFSTRRFIWNFLSVHPCSGLNRSFATSGTKSAMLDGKLTIIPYKSLVAKGLLSHKNCKTFPVLQRMEQQEIFPVDITQLVRDAAE